MKKILYLTAILVSVLGSVSAQDNSANVAPASTKAQGRYELATNFTYKFAKVSETSHSFVLPGVSVDTAYKFNSQPNGFALAIDANAETAHAIEPGVNLSQFSVVVGPRYYFSLNKSSAHVIDLYGQALFGFDAASNSVFPHATGLTGNATSVAYQAGGGANIRLSHNLSLRLLEADFITTSLPNHANNRQYDVRLANGLVFHF
jgi:opacity protein-like surface antigen